MSPGIKLSILSADKIIRAIFGMVIFVFIANYLEPVEVGIYSLVMSMIAISVGFIGFGISSIVVVDGARNYIINSKIIHQDLFIRSISALLIFFLSIAVIYFFYKDTDIFNYYFIISTYLLSQIGATFENDFKALGQPHKITLIKISPTLLTFIIKIYILVAFQSLSLILLVIACEAFVNFILLWYFSSISIKKGFKNSLYRIPLKDNINLIKRSLPFLFSFIAMMLYSRLDQFFISNMVGFEQLAIYSVSIKLQDTAIGFIFILNIYFIRHLSQSYGSSKFESLYRGITSLAVSIAVLALILWLLFGYLILDIFFKEIYLKSYLTTLILFVGVMVQSSAVIRTNYYILTDSQNIIYISSAAGLIINIVLNYLLIPIYGIEGAAIASLISQFISLILINIIYAKTRILFFWMFFALLIPFNKFNFKLTSNIITGKIS
jgi:O-antigen/teichoic acid export membrane protein